MSRLSFSLACPVKSFSRRGRSPAWLVGADAYTSERRELYEMIAFVDGAATLADGGTLRDSIGNSGYPVFRYRTYT